MRVFFNTTMKNKTDRQQADSSNNFPAKQAELTCLCMWYRGTFKVLMMTSNLCFEVHVVEWENVVSFCISQTFCLFRVNIQYMEKGSNWVKRLETDLTRF